MNIKDLLSFVVTWHTKYLDSERNARPHHWNTTYPRVIGFDGVNNEWVQVDCGDGTVQYVDRAEAKRRGLL